MGILIEDMTPGLCLVVIEGEKWKQPIGPWSEQTRTMEDRSLHGFILEVIAVTPPYVLVKTLYPELLQGVEMRHKRILVDTRRYEFAVASAAVVQALMGPVARAQPSQTMNVQFVPPPAMPPESHEE